MLAVVVIVVATSGGDDEDAGNGGTGVTTTADETTTSDGGSTTTFIVGPGEVLAEPANDIGPLPFTDPVADPNRPAVSTTLAPSTTTSSATTSVATATTATGETTVPTTAGGAGPAPQAIPPVPGNVPGLYGGTNNDRVCDSEQMITFLQANPQKATAWAGAQGIAVADIASYIRTLTPVLLMSDTRLTNYGFQNGLATKRQVVLQAGTAVLVDELGVPRARCLCGNPLAPPELNSGPTTTYTGKPWNGFDPKTIIVVVPSSDPIDVLILRDPDTLVISVGRPVGTSGASDVVPPPPTTVPPTTAPPTTGPPTTAAPTSVATTAPPTTAEPTTLPPTTAPPTTEPPPAPNIERGSTNFDATTVFPGAGIDSRVTNAFDGRDDTSWFSAGDADTTCVHPFDSTKSCSELSWANATEVDVFIEDIVIKNNANHPQLTTANKFGFNSVSVQVFDLAGNRTFPVPGADPAQDFISLNGPGLDPSPLQVPVNVKGHRVVLLFEGHDDPTCGGISELEIYASPITGVT